MVHECAHRHTYTRTHVHIHAHIPEYTHSLETQENFQRRVNRPQRRRTVLSLDCRLPYGCLRSGTRDCLKSCWNNWELCYGLGVPLGKSLCLSLNPQSTVLGGGANRRDLAKRSQASWTTGFFALSSTPPSYPLLSCHKIPQDRGSHRVLVPVILSLPFSRTVGNKKIFPYKLSSLWYSVIAAQDRLR